MTCQCCKGGCCFFDTGYNYHFCQSLTPSECESVGGTFYGLGVQCYSDGNCCPPPDPDNCEACVELWQDYFAASTTCPWDKVCVDGECVLLGSCCFPNGLFAFGRYYEPGTCFLNDEGFCNSYGGTWRPGRSCGNPVQCDDCENDDCNTLCVTGFEPFTTPTFPELTGTFCNAPWVCPEQEPTLIFPGGGSGGFDYELAANTNSLGVYQKNHWSGGSTGSGTGGGATLRAVCGDWKLTGWTLPLSTGVFEWGVTFDLDCGSVSEDQCDPLEGMTCSGTVTWFFRSCPAWCQGVQYGWFRNISGSYTVSGITISAGACQ